VILLPFNSELAYLSQIDTSCAELGRYDLYLHVHGMLIELSLKWIFTWFVHERDIKQLGFLR
jgi:hypothetical protein